MPRKKKPATPQLTTSRDELEQRRDSDGRVPVSDVVEASVLTMFFVQKLGKASIDEIRAKIEEVSGTIDPFLCSQAVEALQARGLVSYARGRAAGSGESVLMWKPRQAIWASPPEVAHLVELLPALVATPEAQELITILNRGEAQGEGEKKSGRKLGYDEYCEVEVDLITLDELLGSQPASPRLDTLCKKSPHNGVKADLRFWRDERDGALVIGADAVRGWLRTGLRVAGYSDVVSTYLAVDPIRIVPDKPLQQVCLPIVDKSGGKGTPTYEAVQPGQRITLRLRFPVRGFMAVDQFRAWIAGYAPRPIRGLSPARGARFGKCAVVAFREVGDLRSARTMVDSVMDVIPDEARAFYEGLQASLAVDDVNIRKGSRGAVAVAETDE